MASHIFFCITYVGTSRDSSPSAGNPPATLPSPLMPVVRSAMSKLLADKRIVKSVKPLAKATALGGPLPGAQALTIQIELVAPSFTKVMIAFFAITLVTLFSKMKTKFVRIKIAQVLTSVAKWINTEQITVKAGNTDTTNTVHRAAPRHRPHAVPIKAPPPRPPTPSNLLVCDTGSHIFEQQVNTFGSHHRSGSSDDDVSLLVDESADEGKELPIHVSTVGGHLSNPQDQLVFFSSVEAPSAHDLHNYFMNYTLGRGAQPANWLDHHVHASPSCRQVMENWRTMAIKAVQSEYPNCQVGDLLPWCPECSSNWWQRMRCFGPNPSNSEAWLHMFGANTHEVCIPWEFRRNGMFVNDVYTPVVHTQVPPQPGETPDDISKLTILRVLNQARNMST